MPRPQTKQELLDGGAATYAALVAMVGALTPEQCDADFAFEDRDRNARDVLAHLHEWNLLMLDWVSANMAGESASFLPEGYTWEAYEGLNVEMRDKHVMTTLGEAEALLAGSRARLVALIESLSDDELFTEDHFPWAESTVLAEYAYLETASHDEWAMEKIRRHALRLGH